jgi:hypothetical protein
MFCLSSPACDAVLVARYLVLGAMCLCAPWPVGAEEPPRDQPAAQGNVDAATGPRVVVRLTVDLFRPLIDREIDETKPVDDVVLGTRVRGTSRTMGRPSLELLENESAASFDVQLFGTTTSRTVGQNGPAIIRTRADSSFGAAKRVTFVPGKGFQAEPARVNVNTRTTTESIESARRGPLGIAARIVEREASEQVEAQRPQVTAIAREKARARIAAAFDRALDARVAEFNEDTSVRRAIAALMSLDGDSVYTCCTRDGCVLLAASRKGGASAAELPALGRNAPPVQIWFHKSLLGEEAAGVLNQLERVGAAGLAKQALDILPPVMRPDIALLGRTERTPRIDYATTDEWIVLAVQPEPERVAERIQERRDQRK